MPTIPAQWQSLAEAWRAAARVVVFTGAGMSTASGLPDFRSEQGLWRNHPQYLFSYDALMHDPRDTYFFYQWRIQHLWRAQPNIGHCALGALERAGHLAGVITQNVDGLHQRGGVSQIIELHGTLLSVSCMECAENLPSHALLPAGDFEAAYRAGSYQPGPETRCPVCTGRLRPNVVLFGEMLPSGAMECAEAWSRDCDLMIVAGSSLAVGPANLCPVYARRSGARLAILNAEPTPMDDTAEWVIRDPLERVLAAVEEQILGVSAVNTGGSSPAPRNA